MKNDPQRASSQTFFELAPTNGRDLWASQGILTVRKRILSHHSPKSTNTVAVEKRDFAQPISMTPFLCTVNSSSTSIKALGHWLHLDAACLCGVSGLSYQDPTAESRAGGRARGRAFLSVRCHMCLSVRRNLIYSTDWGIDAVVRRRMGCPKTELSCHKPRNTLADKGTTKVLWISTVCIATTKLCQQVVRETSCITFISINSFLGFCFINSLTRKLMERCSCLLPGNPEGIFALIRSCILFRSALK